MTKEDKDLLLKDLSARLPYDVLMRWRDNDVILSPVMMMPYILEGGKPYLRPMESMTEDEENEWDNLAVRPLLERIDCRHTRKEDITLRARSQHEPIDWLLSHHFDYRGLIEKGLALEKQ